MSWKSAFQIQYCFYCISISNDFTIVLPHGPRKHDYTNVRRREKSSGVTQRGENYSNIEHHLFFSKKK